MDLTDPYSVTESRR